MPDIKWYGNQYTNSSDRKGYVPFAIVDHISAGTMSSMDNWFRDPDNSVSSAHYGVSKSGEIHQYVDIRRIAWGNGATVDMYPAADKLAQIVKDNYGVNPNLYTVSIEHEGTDGKLTEAQFEASVWLHGYIRDQIAEIYGVDYRFPLDSYHVIGHYQVSRLKPSCPGPYFPWSRLYSKFKEDEEDMKKIEELEKEIDELKAELQAIKDGESLPPPDWAKEAVKAATTPGANGKTLLDTDVEIRGSTDFYRQLVVLHRAGLIV